jgi:hypothetical protein
MANINEQAVGIAPKIVLEEGSPDSFLLDPRFIKTESSLTAAYTQLTREPNGGGGGGDGGGGDPETPRPSLDDIISFSYDRKLAPGGATVVTLKIKFRNSSGKVIKGFDARVPQA